MLAFPHPIILFISATRIVEYAYDKGRASTYPEPEDKEAFVRSYQYETDYDSFVPPTWGWPGVSNEWSADKVQRSAD